MNIIEYRKNYFHIDGIKTEARARAQGQETVEQWIAKGNTPEIVPMGQSSYLSEIEKANVQKNSKKYGRHHKGITETHQ